MQYMWKILCFFVVVAAPCIASPKLSYELMEHYRAPEYKNLLAVRVKLIPEGFPQFVQLKITQQEIDGFFQNYESKNDFFYVGANGELCNLNGSGKFSLVNCARGQPSTFTVSTLDGSYIASVDVIPLPLEAKDEKGRTLSIKMVSPNATIFSAEAKGLTPGEKVELCSQSCHEIIPSIEEVPSDGRLIMMLAPEVIGHEMGDASVSLKNDKGLNLKVNYIWGRKVFD